MEPEKEPLTDRDDNRTALHCQSCGELVDLLHYTACPLCGGPMAVVLVSVCRERDCAHSHHDDERGLHLVPLEEGRHR